MSRVQSQAGARPDSMVQWPECWEAWCPEFNPRPGLDQTQWYSGLSGGRHGVQSSIPGRGWTRLNGTVA